MPAAYKGVANTGDSMNTTNRGVTGVAGLAANDVAVAFLHRWESANPTVTPPASGTWTRKSQIVGVDGLAKVDVWWKRLTASDSGNIYSFSWGTTMMYSALSVLWFSGVVTTGDPIGSINSWTGTAGTFGSVSVTSAGAPALVWYGYNDFNGIHTPPTHTQSGAQFIELTDPDCDTCAYRLPGTTGTHTASGGSVDSSGPAIAVLLALEPADGAPPAVAKSFLPFF
jgi:hypothetical protein